jgi:NAD(P)-dependent dehydrogenase (short-subunit alcohol dehydrogenase family)
MCVSVHETNHTRVAINEKCFFELVGQMNAKRGGRNRDKAYVLGMKNALVLGATGGIGRAIAQKLEAQGTAVTRLSRADGLDVADPSTIERELGALSDQFDLIFVAMGVLAGPDQNPEKSLSALTAQAMHDVLAVNTVGPALILRHAARLLPKDRRGVVAVLSARVGSIGDNQIGGWYSYRASKAAVNQIVHGAAIELKRSHRHSICVVLHPGTVETPFTADYAGRHKTVPADLAADNLLRVISDLDPDQTGGFFDYAGAVIPW